MGYNENVYYSPEKSGLELMDSLDRDLSWEYETLILLKDTVSERIFYAYDMGCSCPTPFEEYYFNDANDNDLNEITKENFNSFEQSVRGFDASFDQRAKMVGTAKMLLKD